MKLSAKRILQFQAKIFSWYEKHKRDLPWRRTRDPYKILVSEVMSQQTQLSRVIPKYEVWLQEFPTIESLANAKTTDVLRLWSGLGYNRRAVYLQKAAKEIVERYKGKWPHDVLELQKLPGIGKYTAGAVACFAFDRQVAVVDTNIRKVILIKFCQNHPEPAEGSPGGQQIDSGQAGMTDIEIQHIADQLLPLDRAYEWNQALMDYTAAVLKKEKVPVIRQSKFTGSTRYYRGKVLRLLLQHQRLSAKELEGLLRDTHMPKENIWFTKLLTNLERDGLIKRQKNSLQLP